MKLSRRVAGRKWVGSDVRYTVACRWDRGLWLRRYRCRSTSTRWIAVVIVDLMRPAGAAAGLYVVTRRRLTLSGECTTTCRICRLYTCISLRLEKRCQCLCLYMSLLTDLQNSFTVWLSSTICNTLILKHSSVVSARAAFPTSSTLAYPTIAGHAHLYCR